MDVLVTAAGTSLQMGSDVAGALRTAADGPIHHEAASKGPIGLGEVAVAGASGLGCEWVLRDVRVIACGDGEYDTTTGAATAVGAEFGP